MTEMDPRAPKGAKGGTRVLHLFALMAVFGAELALFCVATKRHYAWFYPRGFDQLQYLREAYAAYDQMQLHGLAGGAREALAQVSPQGSLHGLFAMLVFAVAGPSRTSALAVNMLAFIALQAATFFSVRRISGSYALGWASLGLLAALRLPWSGGFGSATDFRLDWMAACLYGVALSAAIAGNGFRSTRWAVAFGAAVGVVLLTRYLTAVYFCVIFLALLVGLLSQPNRWKRIGRLVLSAACALALSSWAFWRGRHALYTYYWVGHFAGREGPLRDSHLGPLASAKWMMSELLLQQIGIGAALVGLAAGILFLLSRRPGGAPTAASGYNPVAVASAWPVVAIFLVAPAAVLILQPAKPSQPLSVLISPVAWLVVLGWIRLSRRSGWRRVALICAGSWTAGTAVFAASQLTVTMSAPAEAEYRTVNAISDYLYFRAEEAGIPRPRVSVTCVIDSLNAASLEIVGRERHGRDIAFFAMLPQDLFAEPDANVWARFAQSDFVCLVTRCPITWPFDRQMAAMLPSVRRWCGEHLRHDGDAATQGFSVSIYERPFSPRRGEGAGVELAAMVAASMKGPGDAPVLPPGPPLMLLPDFVSWTTKAELSYKPSAAYSPIRFRGIAMPAGLSLDERSGEIRGWLRQVGPATATVEAENAAGESRADFHFRIQGDDWGNSVAAPKNARVGESVEISFAAFDPAASLDFIDITDLTSRRVLDRLVAGEDDRRNWEGRYRTAFHEAGTHTVVFRTVRYDSDAKEQYTFVDRRFDVVVEP